MKKLITILSIFLIAIQLNSGVSAAGITFEEQFKDFDTAQAVSSALGLEVGDEITADVIASTKVLNLESKKLDDIEGIGIFANLEELNLRRNAIPTLPDDFVQLQNLSVLDMYFNNLAKFPAQLQALQNLTKLELGKNVIQDMSVEQQVFVQSIASYSLNNQSFTMMQSGYNELASDFSPTKPLPLVRQIKEYNNGSSVSYRLIRPDSTTVNITVENNGDILTVSGANLTDEGEYTLLIDLHYDGTDQFLKYSVISCRFYVYESNPITMTLNGQNKVEIELGSTYLDAGAKAFDSKGQEVSVKLVGSVDSSKVGTYKVWLSASNQTSNVALERTVIVKEKSATAPIDTEKVDTDKTTGTKQPESTNTTTSAGPNTADMSNQQWLYLLLILSLGVLVGKLRKITIPHTNE